ncbi:lysosomal glucosyl ceramidase-like type III secretion effector SrfJ [Salmonella enterica subsp. enterica serovar Derby]|uniref:Lysosomal glucosyl ceramidase-like type III secretion effector SrfJ n=1 Tax=Salmonella derby TaxID=28144 RepID=A0A601XL17_SALDE|nr:lysosomal glucosyl ceramidase-like type III secretion effector SrfJ [Salmonella enterica subsp. enterica serovar Derby]ECT6130295.1 lysosomal glucosyl ceramidase-like type III secretion effector SrfJ [Salmonella enterica subsp. enterica serovar Derby]ECX1516332.1 lysosomal glucosyl ceramidase-like type III secretion effector SrfJ [Salmonella enterica subsp. enterica serovar Derby]ECX6865073.1 lysosomal glucosyl ceramidase-like type III secretion effector SrfJ [Salmonella enterica subsp. enter
MKGRLISSDPYRQQFLVERAVSFSYRQRDCSELISVLPRHTLQQIDGFGGSFTEGAGVVFNSMSEKTKAQFLSLYFSAQEHNYTLARMPIQCCDFSLGNYAYVDSSADLQQGRLSFSRDEAHLIPLISGALRLNPHMKLMASPWSPPAFMKTNNDMNGGGKLRRECYADWADIIINYLLEYRRHGINVQALSVQNEPVAVKTWDSCLYSVEEETAFAVQYLRPRLARQGMDEMEIYIWDHDKDGLVDWAELAFADEANYKGINGLAFHWYTGDHFSQIQYLAQCLPDKKLLFSEGCVPMESDAGSQIRHWHTYLHDMIGNFKSGCSGFIDWNLLLNSEGGPNHQGNLCEAPIQYDAQNDVLRRNHSWYGIGHFCRYVRPGARVMLSSSYDNLLEEVGFVNPDGERVLVVYNRDVQERRCRVLDGDKEIALTLPPSGASTLLWRQESI